MNREQLAKHLPLLQAFIAGEPEVEEIDNFGYWLKATDINLKRLDRYRIKPTPTFKEGDLVRRKTHEGPGRIVDPPILAKSAIVQWFVPGSQCERVPLDELILLTEVYTPLVFTDALELISKHGVMIHKQILPHLHEEIIGLDCNGIYVREAFLYYKDLLNHSFHFLDGTPCCNITYKDAEPQ